MVDGHIDPWTLATSEEDGRFLIIRFRSRPPVEVALSDYPHVMIVQWPYEPSAGQGLPVPSVLEQMEALDNALAEALEPGSAAFNTAVVTGGGMREWQWYARDPAEFMRLVNSGLADHPPFPVAFVEGPPDPGWKAYFEIGRSVRKP